MYKKKFVKVATVYGEGFYLIKNFDEYDDIGSLITKRNVQQIYQFMVFLVEFFVIAGYAIYVFLNKKKLAPMIKSSVFRRKQIEILVPWAKMISVTWCKSQKSKVYFETEDFAEFTCYDSNKHIIR